jgi:hypothetical protein
MGGRHYDAAGPRIWVIAFSRPYLIERSNAEIGPPLSFAIGGKFRQRDLDLGDRCATFGESTTLPSFSDAQPRFIIIQWLSGYYDPEPLVVSFGDRGDVFSTQGATLPVVLI